MHESAREFFKKTDSDHDLLVSLKEFKSYLKKDRGVLGTMIAAGVTAPEELGTDFGSGTNGIIIDDDLQLECNPLLLRQDNQKVQKADNIKQEDDVERFEEEDLGEGDEFLATR